MKTYDKRVAFCISDQHVIPHGGIGQFAKGFVEMAGRLNWKVDLILDKAPTNTFCSLIESLGANTVYPDTPLKYSEHVGIFAFNESINFEKTINFRNCLMKALTTNLYDMIVCNTWEAMLATHLLGITSNIPTVFYTHHESMVFRQNRKDKGVFTHACNEFANKLIEFDDVIVGTQSDRNKNELIKEGVSNVVVLGMPMTERELLVEYLNETEGVLWLGRWEKLKNPEAFIKLIKETGLPAKVMTNANGKKKFEAEFKAAGITNYKIAAGVVGKEKVDFIRSSRVHYNTSLRESYGFAFIECLAHMPCVVLDKADWANNFDTSRFHVTKEADAAELIKKIYYNEVGGALDYVMGLDNAAQLQWADIMANSEWQKSSTNAAKINEVETTKYSKFIVDLERKALAIEDITSVLTNRHKFNIIYTDKETYLTKDKDFVPTEEDTNTLDDIFA